MQNYSTVMHSRALAPPLRRQELALKVSETLAARQELEASRVRSAKTKTTTQTTPATHSMATIALDRKRVLLESNSESIPKVAGAGSWILAAAAAAAAAASLTRKRTRRHLHF